MTYNATRDLLDKVDGQFSTEHKATFGYAYDAFARRTSTVFSGEIFARYQGQGVHNVYSYNDRSEVTGATAYTGQTVTDTSGTSALVGRKFDYGYDPIGNRVTSAVNGHTVSYTPNALNQYTSRTVPADSEVTGLGPSNAGRHGQRPSRKPTGRLFLSHRHWLKCEHAPVVANHHRQQCGWQRFALPVPRADPGGLHL